MKLILIKLNKLGITLYVFYKYVKFLLYKKEKKKKKHVCKSYNFTKKTKQKEILKGNCITAANSNYN